MMFELFKSEIRDKIPRKSVMSFDDLVESARSIESVLREK